MNVGKQKLKVIIFPFLGMALPKYEKARNKIDGTGVILIHDITLIKVKACLLYLNEANIWEK